jgi:hypothetical protein
MKIMRSTVYLNFITIFVFSAVVEVGGEAGWLVCAGSAGCL